MSEPWGHERGGEDPGTPDRHGRDALAVLLLVLFGGWTLIALTDRFIHLGTTAGNIAFAVLPLVAAGASATRLHHRN